MRDIRRGVCPLCEYEEIVQGVPAEFTGAGSYEVQPYFTHPPRLLLTGREPHRGFGKLTYYMCRRCGYLQWFVEKPEEVPIGERFQTSLITPSRQGPYR